MSRLAAVVIVVAFGLDGAAGQVQPTASAAGGADAGRQAAERQQAGGRGAGREGGRGGSQPQVPSISQRPNGASLGTIRAGADNTLWFGWRVGMPSTAITGLTFSEALAKWTCSA